MPWLKMHEGQMPGRTFPLNQEVTLIGRDAACQIVLADNQVLKRHARWAHWTRYFLDHLTPENVERWRRQIDTPYERLSETEKQSDREWADRVLELVRESTPPEERDGGSEPDSLTWTR